MTKGRFLLIGVVLVAAFGLMLSGCGGSDEKSDADQGTQTSASLLDDIVKRGTIKVGMSTFEPWAMKDKTGKLIGFEIDVATRLAADMGVEIEFVPTQWSGIIPALLTGKFDVIIGGMGIQPERNLKVNFSIPYDYSGMAMVANRQLAPGFASLEEFNKSDVIVAARLGTTAAKAVNQFLPNAEVRLFESEPLAVQELLNGNVHVLVASAPLPAFTALENPDKFYVPFDGTFTYEPIGFALQKGDVDLLNYFNNWITLVDSEGWLAERKQYWFGTQNWKGLIE